MRWLLLVWLAASDPAGLPNSVHETMRSCVEHGEQLLQNKDSRVVFYACVPGDKRP